VLCAWPARGSGRWGVLLRRTSTHRRSKRVGRRGCRRPEAPKASRLCSRLQHASSVSVVGIVQKGAGLFATNAVGFTCPNPPAPNPPAPAPKAGVAAGAAAPNAGAGAAACAYMGLCVVRPLQAAGLGPEDPECGPDAICRPTCAPNSGAAAGAANGLAACCAGAPKAPKGEAAGWAGAPPNAPAEIGREQSEKSKRRRQPRPGHITWTCRVPWQGVVAHLRTSPVTKRLPLILTSASS
jgi:hypothetical protein